MNYNNEFKIIIPNIKEEIFSIDYKKISLFEGFFCIEVAGDELKEINYFLEQEEDFCDAFTEPNLELYLKLTSQEIAKLVQGKTILLENELENEYNCIYYFEHLDIENLKVSMRLISKKEIEVHINGCFENVYNSGEDIIFSVKEVFEINFLGSQLRRVIINKGKNK